MNICLVCPFVTFGGSELATITLASALNQSGVRVVLLSNAHPKLEDEAQSAGVEVKVLKYGVFSEKNKPIKLSRTIWGLREYFSENSFDIVHSSMVTPLTLIYLALQGSRQAPKLVLHSRGVSNRTFKYMLPVVKKMADHVIANCDAEAVRYIENGFDSNVSSVYNPPNIIGHVDSAQSLREELGLGADTPIIVSVSRISPDRCISDILEAAKLILISYPNSAFVIVGEGPHRGKLECIANLLGIADKVYFLGARRDLQNIYESALCSISCGKEGAGTGNNNAESLYYGTPVVAHRLSGVGEVVVHEKTGLLYDGDATVIAQNVKRLLGDTKFASRLGRDGAKHVRQNFSTENLVKKVTTVYQNLLQG